MLTLLRADPRYQASLHWGEPRSGHPEGTILAHILELERNLAALAHRLLPGEEDRLRVLIHVHDTFKPQAEDVAIRHTTSHASLARSFLEEFTRDAALLEAVQYHDEGYALWRQWKSRGYYNKYRLQHLLNVIPDWDLFLLFCIVDGCTPGKSREPLSWFLELVAPEVSTRVESAWLHTPGLG